MTTPELHFLIKVDSSAHQPFAELDTYYVAALAEVAIEFFNSTLSAAAVKEGARLSGRGLTRYSEAFL